MKVLFSKEADKGYLWWQKHDPKKLERIQALCRDILEHPLEGIGKPEPLKFGLQGCWSRRIDKTHRIVYVIKNDCVVIISCRFHY